VTAVFFLFLTHLAWGLLLMLPFVPERAGRSYFKFCSAASCFMAAAALLLLWRRFAFSGGSGAPGGAYYRVLVGLLSASLVATLIYNRAHHFGWRRARGPLLAAALSTATAGLLLAAHPAGRFAALSDLTSVWLLGAAASAMILGHWYLVVIDLPIAALRRLTVLLFIGLGLRALVVGGILVGPLHAGFEEARAVVLGLPSADGVFVWMRLLFGIVGPASLSWFIWRTVEIRSTQSATGILYVQLFLVLSGELLAKYLRVISGLPL
jgi:protein NrfD